LNDARKEIEARNNFEVIFHEKDGRFTIKAGPKKEAEEPKPKRRRKKAKRGVPEGEEEAAADRILKDIQEGNVPDWPEVEDDAKILFANFMKHLPIEQSEPRVAALLQAITTLKTERGAEAYEEGGEIVVRRLGATPEPEPVAPSPEPRKKGKKKKKKKVTKKAKKTRRAEEAPRTIRRTDALSRQLLEARRINSEGVPELSKTDARNVARDLFAGIEVGMRRMEQAKTEKEEDQIAAQLHEILDAIEAVGDRHGFRMSEEGEITYV